MRACFLLSLFALFVAGCSGGTTLNISATDQMTFSASTLTATAGKNVTLTLTHAGSMPVETMGHNLVILAEGTDEAAFVAAANEAGAAAGYIPAGMSESIIAHTELIGGGASTTITFTAPAAGTYTFLCTFPGHAALMRGEFIVQ